MGKEEIARNEQFLLFTQCFSTQSDNSAQFVHIFDIIFLFAAELEEPKIGYDVNDKIVVCKCFKFVLVQNFIMW